MQLTIPVRFRTFNQNPPDPADPFDIKTLDDPFEDEFDGEIEIDLSSPSLRRDLAIALHCFPENSDD